MPHELLSLNCYEICSKFFCSPKHILLRIILIYIIVFCTNALATEDFFKDAKNLFDQGKFEESKFLFQRNIVFNPKDSNSYLYLAKIYQTEENEAERNDEDYKYVAAWDYSENEDPKLFKEKLKYNNVKLKTRSYK